MRSLLRHLNFDSFIVPAYIKLLYPLLAAAGLVASGVVGWRQGGLRSVALGLAVGIAGVIILRIHCELVMIWFKIHERLDQRR